MRRFTTSSSPALKLILGRRFGELSSKFCGEGKDGLVVFVKMSAYEFDKPGGWYVRREVLAEPLVAEEDFHAGRTQGAC